MLWALKESQNKIIHKKINYYSTGNMYLNSLKHADITYTIHIFYHFINSNFCVPSNFPSNNPSGFPCSLPNPSTVQVFMHDHYYNTKPLQCKQHSRKRLKMNISKLEHNLRINLLYVLTMRRKYLSLT